MLVIASQLTSVWGKIVYFLLGLRVNFAPTVFIDIAIVAFLFYWIYLFLRETRALRILYGFLILVLAMLIAKIFNLILLNFLLRYLTTALIVAIPIVFQPELRQVLEKIGRPRFWTDIQLTRDNFSNLLNEIVLATEQFSKQKVGALIIIQRSTGLREYIENGIRIDAKVSAGLLNSIFFPKSPLHDGAVIIIGRRILSASSILPVAEIDAGRNLGTRHRAAIGVTQVSDAVAVVVSEETGSISIAVSGELERRITSDRLRSRLYRLLRKNVKPPSRKLFFWPLKKKEEDK